MYTSCEHRCVMERECVSVNIGPPINDKKVCELSDSDHLQHPQDLKPRHGWTYTGTEVREGTFFLGGGRAGASEGKVNSESEYQKGRAIPHVSYSREGHTSFREFFNENFCDVAFPFSYRLSFSFHQL